ncbi:MAG TPA: TlpA disulfide reductase family protein [Bryobacteraceae bacterium]|jgi:cytochrome c biogenesis protein CcmG/thiol:disulfide interchange protein DsbE|nr:TlpA disulfide reductase family protein [Bryobacteraceae bacterium]
MTKFFTAGLVCALLIQTASADNTIRASIRPASSREKAPAFTLMNASGHAVRLSDYKGKVVVLNFWAVNCGGCRLELPSFVDINNSYKSKGLAVVGISMDISYEDLKDAKEAWARVNPFLPAHHIDYTILMGDSVVEKAYQTDALPATYLIDKDGRVAATYVGVVNKDNLEANIKTVLTGR